MNDAHPNEPLVAELDLAQGAPETPTAGLFGPSSGRTYFDWLMELRDLAKRDNVKGIFVRLGSGSDLGLARAQELGGLLATLRAAGKPVVCHANDYDQPTLLFVSKACDEIWLSPAGGVDAVGLAFELVFMRELLDKLHIEVDMLQVGKYKGANESLTRDSVSPEARESYKRALSGLREAWIGGITEGRKRPDLSEIVEDGPFSAEDAKARGLVDEVGYESDARSSAAKRAGVSLVTTRYGGAGRSSQELVGVLRALSGSEGTAVPHLAVVRASGAISMGGTGSPLGGSDGIAERDLGKTLRRLTEDDAVRAVVLRIDSPGGSALASDLLWKQLMALRAEKPLVVSVGGMAASGGYYMACTGTKIFAEPTSIVGSIGVVGGKVSFGKALEQFGVHVESITATDDPVRSARASYMSTFAPWDDATKGRVLDSMTDIYELFLTRVAEGRKIPRLVVEKSAEGQLFGGVIAKERSLVDELGGLDDAMRFALNEAGLPEDAPIEAVGEPQGLLGLLGGAEEEQDEESKAPAAEAVGRAAVASLIPEWSQFAPEMRLFLLSVWPAVEGERSLAALPFGLRVR